MGLSRLQRQWMTALTRELGFEAQLQASRGVPSRTLIQAMELRRSAASRVRLHIPHYWAVYLHDGSGPIRMPPGKFMIWFKNPAQDPRLSGGHPVRVRDRKHLTRSELVQAVRQNQVVITRYVGRREGARFFDNETNMRPFIGKVSEIVPRRFSELVRREIPGVGRRLRF